MISNLYPVKNLAILSQPRTLFLRDLYKPKEIDIFAQVYHLLAKCVQKKKSRMNLPFPGLLMSILLCEKVKFLTGWVAMTREDPISSQTMTRSKAHIPSNEREAEGEGAQGEATAAEVGDTEDEIDWFTLDPEDIPPSPSQAQP